MPDAPATDPSSNHFFDRALRAFTRTVVIFSRQSSDYQRQHNVGSQLVMSDERRHLAPFNVPDDRIVEIVAAAESAAGEKPRPVYDELIRLADTGRVGVIVASRHDRFNREKAGHQELMAVTRKHGIMLMIAGRLYDPSDDNDALLLGVHAEFAIWENRVRSRWHLLTRLALARKGRLRINLPAPLAWCPVDDPAYATAMADAGLSDLVDAVPAFDPLAPFQAQSVGDGVRYAPLPVPDKRAMLAARRFIALVVEAGSVTGAIDATYTDPEWPTDEEGRPSLAGRFPHHPGVIYDPASPIEWREMTADGMRGWLKSPATWGTYSFTAPGLARDASEQSQRALRHRVHHAFQGVGDADDFARVKAALEADARPARGATPAAERRHILPAVFCVTRRLSGKRAGTPCGGRLSARTAPRFSPGCDVRYASSACSRRGHTGDVPAYAVERVVLDAIRSVFTKARLAAALDRVRLGARSAATVRDTAERELARVTTRENAALELVITARVERDARREAKYAARADKLGLEREKLQEELRDAERDTERLRAATKQEAARVVALGGDLPTLLDRVAADPLALRRIVSACVSAVYVERLGKFAYAVDVAFPAGGRIRRYVFTCVPRSTQAERTYARVRLEVGVRAEVVAREMSADSAGAFGGSKWTADRVRGAAALARHAEPEPARAGAHLTAVALAALVQSTPDAVTRAGLRGALGPARPTAGVGRDERPDGERSHAGAADARLTPCIHALEYAPTEVELERTFLEYARAQTAVRSKWQPDDTATLSEAARAGRVTHHAVRYHCRKHDASHIARDLAGRVYVRQSMAPFAAEVAAFEAALDAAGAEVRALDPAAWVTDRDGRSRFNARWDDLCAHAPALAVPQPSGTSRTFRWVGAPVIAAMCRADRVQALAAMGRAELGPDDFFPQAQFVAGLRARFAGYPSDALVNAAFAAGRITQIHAFGTDGGPQLARIAHLHVPAEVRDASRVAPIRAWLEGPPRERARTRTRTIADHKTRGR